MAYNRNNVDIVDYLGFKNQGGGGLAGNPIYDKRVLAEGDSWFHIGGITKAERNLIDAVNFKHKHTLLLNMAKSGDTMANMSQRLNNQFLYQLMKDHKWDFILLSAGGNDLIDALIEKGNYEFNSETLSIIKSNSDGSSFKDFINYGDLDLFRKSILNNFKEFQAIKDATINKSTPVIIHTYDFPTPRNAPATVFYVNTGPWLYKALTYKRVDKRFWVEIADEIFTALADTIISLDGKNNFNVAKTAGSLERAWPETEGNDHDWLNEIHPNSKGITKIASKINKKIESLM